VVARAHHFVTFVMLELLKLVAPAPRFVMLELVRTLLALVDFLPC
jgi:hypothetical protein